MAKAGNVLGDPRAEADTEMLQRAFLLTHDFRALTETRDFNFVVGRRGSGKTALFLQSKIYFKKSTNAFISPVQPEEYELESIEELTKQVADSYIAARPCLRLSWKISLLFEVGHQLATFWKYKEKKPTEALSSLTNEFPELLDVSPPQRVVEILRDSVKHSDDAITDYIVKKYKLGRLEAAVSSALSELGRDSIILIDRLDESWKGTEISTALVGGLAIAVSDIRDKIPGIHTVLFIRDNMFRALAGFDQDFSRHIEGNTIRLHWTEEALFHMVANRIRVGFELEIENDRRIWNRFAKRELRDRKGFQEVLKNTLYRPRDVIVLLNRSYLIAARSGRAEIIGDDVERTAVQISKDRLRDLVNEYRAVFPGISKITAAFQGLSAYRYLSETIEFLNSWLAERKFAEREDSDLAILGSGKEIFEMLYSVGFVGIGEEGAQSASYCHDGARSDLKGLTGKEAVIVHPCYWKGLSIQESDELSLVEVYDDYQHPQEDDVKDQRKRLLGSLVSDLPRMPLGMEGSSEFERWSLRAVQILFSGYLSNPELHPNPTGVSRQDVVATNVSDHGFWRRLLEDYNTRQVVFEVKNYEELKQDDYRQVSSYLGQRAGSFGIIVSRGSSEGLRNRERSWLLDIYLNDHKIVFHVPAALLARCIRKIRNPERFDYADQQLAKRLDTYERRYLKVQSR